MTSRHTRPAPVIAPSPPTPAGAESSRPPGLPPDVARLFDLLDEELAAIRRDVRVHRARAGPSPLDGRLLWCQAVAEIARLRLDPSLASGRGA